MVIERPSGPGAALPLMNASERATHVRDGAAPYLLGTCGRPCPGPRPAGRQPRRGEGERP
jgi:hypothetical protein